MVLTVVYLSDGARSTTDPSLSPFSLFPFHLVVPPSDSPQAPQLEIHHGIHRPSPWPYTAIAIGMHRSAWVPSPPPSASACMGSKFLESSSAARQPELVPMLQGQACSSLAGLIDAAFR